MNEKKISGDQAEATCQSKELILQSEQIESAKKGKIPWKVKIEKHRILQ